MSRLFIGDRTQEWTGHSVYSYSEADIRALLGDDYTEDELRLRLAKQGVKVVHVDTDTRTRIEKTLSEFESVLDELEQLYGEA